MAGTTSYNDLHTCIELHFKSSSFDIIAPIGMLIWNLVALIIKNLILICSLIHI